MGWFAERLAVARRWGSNASERERAYACDALAGQGSDAYFRAVSVAAPASTVYRWLCQLRVAPYSYDWIDNFGRRSPRRLTPGLELLEPGQRVMTIFDLMSFERDRHLTLTLRHGVARATFGQVAVTYAVTPVTETSCRLVAKIVVAHPPALWRWVTRALLPWGDLVMMRRQLLNLRALAEGIAHA